MHPLGTPTTNAAANLANVFRANVFRANVFRANVFRANILRAVIVGDVTSVMITVIAVITVIGAPSGSGPAELADDSDHCSQSQRSRRAS